MGWTLGVGVRYFWQMSSYFNLIFLRDRHGRAAVGSKEAHFWLKAILYMPELPQRGQENISKLAGCTQHPFTRRFWSRLVKGE